jgi:predicted CXXCH cytochrome family protein
MNVSKLAAVLVALLSPLAALAAGGHDAVGCTGCHSLHGAKGEVIFAVAPNKKYLNPKTNQPYTGTTALCLACHAEPDRGGQGYAPVSQHSHPFGLASVNPRVAKVPSELLGEGGRFECMGCHDPHPSNPNYKYLRVSVGPKGEKMDAFCGACHSTKAEGAGGKLAVFTSMDETRATSVPPAPPPAAATPAPKSKK